MTENDEKGPSGLGGVIGKMVLIASPFLLLLALFLLDHCFGGRS